MNTKNYKVLIVIYVIYFVALLILMKLYKSTVIDYTENFTVEHYNFSKKRNNIIDRNGVILATDIDMVSLYLNNSLIENEKEIAQKFYKILKIDKNVLYRKIKNRSKKANLILIKRHLTPKEHLAIKKIGIASTVFEPDLLRFYPQNNLFSHILGYTDIDRNGISGLEQYYDNYLKNSNNKPLQLTMDSTIQFIAREELQKAMTQYNADFATAIITNLKTGDIIAAVSLPDFNPNNITEDLKDDKKIYNRITLGVYELGSIMKIFTVASALSNKVVNRNTLFDISGEIRFGSAVIKEGKQVKKTLLTLDEGLSYSSNKVMVQTIKKVGQQKYQEFMENLGMLEKLNLDINQVGFPMQKRIWKDINLATMSYGYGLAITPMHLLQGVNTIMNNGKFISLRFSYEKKQDEKQIPNLNISKQMAEMLQNVVEKGTGKLAYIKGYPIGGKTGTAETVSKEGYTKNTHRASFIAVFPIENPQYTIFVMINNPVLNIGIAGTGSTTSAIVAKSIIKKIVPLLN